MNTIMQSPVYPLFGARTNQAKYVGGSFKEHLIESSKTLPPAKKLGAKQIERILRDPDHYSAEGEVKRTKNGNTLIQDALTFTHPRRSENRQMVRVALRSKEFDARIDASPSDLYYGLERKGKTSDFTWLITKLLRRKDFDINRADEDYSNKTLLDLVLTSHPDIGFKLSEKEKNNLSTFLREKGAKTQKELAQPHIFSKLV